MHSFRLTSEINLERSTRSRVERNATAKVNDHGTAVVLKHIAIEGNKRDHCVLHGISVCQVFELTYTTAIILVLPHTLMSRIGTQCYNRIVFFYDTK